MSKLKVLVDSGVCEVEGKIEGEAVVVFAWRARDGARVAAQT